VLMIKTCEYCKGIFRIKPSRKDRARYCSKKCRGLSGSTIKNLGTYSQIGHKESPELRLKKSIARRGGKNPQWNKKGELSTNWKGGIYPLNKLARCTSDYQNWIKEVFKRDDYTCQICGARGKKLNSHHIVKFAQRPTLRTNVNNGITLCNECHFMLVNRKEEEWKSYFNFNLLTRAL